MKFVVKTVFAGLAALLISAPVQATDKVTLLLDWFITVSYTHLRAHET